MQPFSYQRVADPAAAIQALSNNGGKHSPLTSGAVQVLAGGTTLLDLMKLDVMQPAAVVDITPLSTGWSEVRLDGDTLRLGALARMSDVAANAEIQKAYPVIADSLKLAASAQLRNMATLGGNVLQRTRCTYFRDVSYAHCNKRDPGSGCAAMDGINRMHAVLGTSDHCIATYPGDFAQSLIALDAAVEITGPAGNRSISFAELHRAPDNSPQLETTLRPDELIAGFTIKGRWPRSVYLKVRDRQSYEFALCAAAVALDVQDGIVRDARLALGGVATVPWRAAAAEAQLRGQRLDEALASRVAEVAFAGARTHPHNAFKIELGRKVVTRALQQAASMEI